MAASAAAARPNSRIYRDGSSGALRLLTTLFTPSTDWATRSASSFSARDVTGPVNMTVPSCERIWTFLSDTALVEYSSNSTRRANLSSALSGLV
jgi:hypothetical protein